MVGHLGTPEIGAGIDFSVRKLLLPRAARRGQEDGSVYPLPERKRREKPACLERIRFSLPVCSQNPITDSNQHLNLNGGSKRKGVGVPTRPIYVGTIALSPAAKLWISKATGVMATDSENLTSFSSLPDCALCRICERDTPTLLKKGAVTP